MGRVLSPRMSLSLALLEFGGPISYWHSAPVISPAVTPFDAQVNALPDVSPVDSMNYDVNHIVVVSSDPDTDDEEYTVSNILFEPYWQFFSDFVSLSLL